jgi:hypothetical protein
MREEPASGGHLYHNASPTSLIRNSSVDEDDNRHPMMIVADNSNQTYPQKNRSVTDNRHRDPPFSAAPSSTDCERKRKMKKAVRVSA